MGCLQSPWSSILVNRSPTQEFKCHKGSCQGDPSTPFLFLIVWSSEASQGKKLVGGIPSG